MATLSKTEVIRMGELAEKAADGQLSIEEKTELKTLRDKMNASGNKIFHSFLPAFIKAGKFDGKGFVPPTIEDFPFSVKFGHKSSGEHEKSVNYYANVLPFVYKLLRDAIASDVIREHEAAQAAQATQAAKKSTGK